MKTTLATRRLSVILLPILFLVACDSTTGAISDPDPDVLGSGSFTIESSEKAVSATVFEGTFESSGMLKDQGTVQQVLSSPEPLRLRPSIFGHKTLVSEDGVIEIMFYTGLIPIDENTLRAFGGFSIVGGEGAYEHLRGGGKIDVEVPANASAAEVTRVLEGVARFLRS